MNKGTIIFDFDGTIANTLEAVVNIYNELAQKYNCKHLSDLDREKIRDKRPQEVFKYYGINRYKLIFLLLKGRKKLSEKITEIQPIIGIPQALKEIKASGYNLGILTSNSKKNVEIFLEANELTQVFDFVHSSKRIFKKEKAIRSIIKRKKLDPKSIVYVGDETRDIESLKRCDIPVIAVSWGFHSKEILRQLNPSLLVDQPSEILVFLNSLSSNIKPCSLKST